MKKVVYSVTRYRKDDTAITLHTIRVWCKEGAVKCLNAGTKILVDMDSLWNHISMKDE